MNARFFTSNAWKNLLLALGCSFALTVVSAPPAAAAETGKIAYQLGNGAHFSIYLINGDGSNNHAVTTDANDYFFPELSPDGNKIAYNMNASGIFLMNPDGTGASVIPNTSGLVVPSWSADGTKLVATDSSTGQISTFNVDGTGVRAITSDTNLYISNPGWSPDGTMIVFAAVDFSAPYGNNYQIYLVAADGMTAPVRFSTDTTASYQEPSWSPDGTTIVCRKGYVIYTLDPTTGAETRVSPVTSNPNASDLFPTFSPDGMEIAFQDYDAGAVVARMNLDGSNRRPYDTNMANTPKWSRAGSTAGGGGGTGATNSFQVPGTANIWLAGVANDTTASNGQDTLANAHPYLVQNVNLATNHLLTFNASGTVTNDPAKPNGTGPDGGPYNGVRFYLHASENGLAKLTAPINSLVGVFLDGNVPAGSAPAGLDFQSGVTGGTNFSSISPALRQPFFIGDGMDDNGRAQTFVVPSGATRLYLGSLDPSQNSNNTGGFAVIVNPPAPPDHGGLSATIFQVNETSAVDPGATADSVLRFLAIQTGHAAGTHVHVQYSQTPGTDATWTDLPDPAHGGMTYEPQVNGYVLNTTSYPTVNGVSFRAVATADGYPRSVSNPVGPFNLASSRPHLNAPLLFVTTNGEVNAVRFGVHQATTPTGISVRVQTSQTPSIETSWTDAPVSGTSGQLVQDPDHPTEFYLGTDDYPEGSGIYFRALSHVAGQVDGLSFAYGPFTFIHDPAAAVTITVDNNSYPDGNTLDDGLLVPQTGIKISARAISGRVIKRLELRVDGATVNVFASDNFSLDYRINIIGDHIVEALATDDLNVTGAAPPVHVRVLAAAPGRTFEMTHSGDWSTAGNWIDNFGVAGVPGANDFAIVGSFSPTLSKDVNVRAVSLNGGTISSAGSTTRTLTVTSFFTVAAGTITTNLGIPPGATCEFLNDGDVGLSSHFACGGTVRLHGKGSIVPVVSGGSSPSYYTLGAQPKDFFGLGKALISGIDYVANAAGQIAHAVGQLVVDVASGGRRGSKSAPPPAAHPAPLAELRKVDVAKIEIPVMTVPPPPLISQDGGGIISHYGGGLKTSPSLAELVAAGGGNLVAAGGGNLIGQDGAGIISHDGGGIISHDGGGVVSNDGAGLSATSGSMVVATGQGNLVAAGGGNLIAAGGGNAPAEHAIADAPADPDSATSGFFLIGGETNLDRLTITGDVELDGGVLSGSGYIFGNVTNNGAYISPGHSAGAISVIGNFAQGANGTLVVEDGGAYPDQYDHLGVSGSATLGGTLDIRTINGYVPDKADTFSPLAFASSSGSFNTVSSNASVTVNPTGLLASADPSVAGPATGQPLNISTRLRVLTGDNVLIGGFIVTGAPGSTKAVLLRGKGPSLADSGLSGVLPDPLLELHKPDGSIVTNDNWQDAPNTARIPDGFAPTNPRESLIIADLAPGSYTVIEKGAHGETGIGLTEIYDIDGNKAVALGNISTRGFADTDDNVMIAGFIVGGTEPASILVRATGPSLARPPANLTGVLEDPILELHDSNGSIITNDNWRETQEAEIIASTVAPADDKEPAILATLAPGSYTAIVRGKDNSTGIAVVEAYRVK